MSSPAAAWSRQLRLHLVTNSLIVEQSRTTRASTRSNTPRINTQARAALFRSNARMRCWNVCKWTLQLSSWYKSADEMTSNATSTCHIIEPASVTGAAVAAGRGDGAPPPGRCSLDAANRWMYWSTTTRATGVCHSLVTTRHLNYTPLLPFSLFAQSVYDNWPVNILQFSAYSRGPASKTCSDRKHKTLCEPKDKELSHCYSLYILFMMTQKWHITNIEVQFLCG